MRATIRALLWVIFLLGLYAFVRFWFLRANWTGLETEGGAAIAGTFLLGLRYDLAAIFLCNLPLLLVYVFYPASRLLNVGIAIVMTCVNGAFLAFNIFDSEYFKFTGKRLTMDSFAITQDINSQIGPIALDYWYNSLLILIVAVLLFWGTRRILTKTHRDGWRVAGFLAFLLALGGGLAIRGGLQTKPLIPAQAFVDSGPKLGILTLNTTFTILKSSNKEGLQEWKGLSLEDAQKQVVRVEGQTESSWNGKKPKNVVLVILESFGSEYVFPPTQQNGYAPFLRELAQRGSNFPSAYANGRRSIDAVPALLAGIPAWMDPPFITSPYQTNRIRGLPEILNENGYHTLFFHGGNNGTMFFDVMTKRLGFQTYMGATEYPHSGDYDGRWGIFDEPFLGFVATRLSEETKPFFASIFTLSSHHPYTIPAAHKGQFPKGTLEIHESIGYADYALRRFYEQAKQEPWFADTLFIFTADHTSKQEFPENDNLKGRFHVPLLFIMNDGPLPFPRIDETVQQADVAPTVLDMLGIEAKPFSQFGISLCRESKRPGIVLFENGAFHLIGSSETKVWRPGEAIDPNDSDMAFLQSLAYLYNNGMVRNRLLW